MNYETCFSQRWPRFFDLVFDVESQTRCVQEYTNREEEADKNSALFLRKKIGASSAP
jgi:hypothetical protein